MNKTVNLNTKKRQFASMTVNTTATLNLLDFTNNYEKSEMFNGITSKATLNSIINSVIALIDISKQQNGSFYFDYCLTSILLSRGYTYNTFFSYENIILEYPALELVNVDAYIEKVAIRSGCYPIIGGYACIIFVSILISFILWTIIPHNCKPLGSIMWLGNLSHNICKEVKIHCNEAEIENVKGIIILNECNDEISHIQMSLFAAAKKIDNINKYTYYAGNN